MNADVSVITTRSLPVAHYLMPTTLARSLWSQRNLIRQLTWRNVLTRYRGSALGMAWSFLFPLLMLTVYTFVFGVVLKARWMEPSAKPVTDSASMLDFALALFSGLLVYNFFAEVISVAPTLILGNPNYVKKVVFPLEVLPVCVLGAAGLQMLVSVAVLLGCSVGLTQHVSSTLYLFPLVIPGLVMFVLGLAWFLASLGVYLRDVSQVIGVLLTIMIFLSPVFYSLEQVPPTFRFFMQLNPLTTLVQTARYTLVWDRPPDWIALAVVTGVSAVMMQLGFVWFMKTKRGFADVL